MKSNESSQSGAVLSMPVVAKIHRFEYLFPRWQCRQSLLELLAQGVETLARGGWTIR
jgi:hypothetical protein